MIPVSQNNSHHGADRNEMVYVADTENHAIRRLVLAPGSRAAEVGTIAGGQKLPPDNVERLMAQVPVAKKGFANGKGAQALFRFPRALAAIRRGPTDTIYVADSKNNAVRRVTVAALFTMVKPLLVGARANARRLLGGKGRATSDPQGVKLGVSHGMGTKHTISLKWNPPSSNISSTRWTTVGGTAARDKKCRFPFIHKGVGYNDCAMVEDAAQGITKEKFIPKLGWCVTAKPKKGAALKWGPCAPPTYTPTFCVVSKWGSFEPCSATCGGGTTIRTRKVRSRGSPKNRCPPLQQKKTCSQHPCGFTTTIAGGLNAGEKVGMGTNVGAVGGPDLLFNPVALSLDAAAEGNTEAVQLAGENSNLLKRINIRHGASNSTCRDITDLCRVVKAADSIIEAKFSNATYTPDFPGVTALASMGAEITYAATKTAVRMMDLSLRMPCHEWMREGLADWPLEMNNGTLYESNPLEAHIDVPYGRDGTWRFRAYKKVKTFRHKGQEPHDMYKHVVCGKESVAGPETEQCCTFKGVPTPVKPQCKPDKNSRRGLQCRTEIADWRASLAPQSRALKGF